MRRLEEERERVENDPYGYTDDGSVDDTDEHASSPDQQPQRGSPARSQTSATQHQPQRKRHSLPSNQPRQNVTPIARPDPIQRPGRVSLPPPGPGVIHLAHSHSHSVPSAKRTPPSNNGSTSGSSSSPSPVPAAASLLSGRASTFAPRGIKSDLNPSSSPFEPRAGLIPVGGMQAKAEAGKKK